jgi:hypothetical protein
MIALTGALTSLEAMAKAYIVNFRGEECHTDP